MNGPHDVFTPAEVAGILRVDPRTVSRWAKQGLLPCFRTPGGHRRFHREDVEKLITTPAGEVFQLTPVPGPEAG
jgi:excisionase family DNA binding protein